MLKPMKRRDLKRMAESYGVEWRWKSSKRIRRDIKYSLGIHPIKSLNDLKTCRGVRDVEIQEWSRSCMVTLHHHWWGRPFIKSNLATLGIFARNKFCAGVPFVLKTTVDPLSERAVITMCIAIGVFVWLVSA